MTPAKSETEEVVPELPEVENSYIIRPNFKEKFKPTVIKDLIHR